MNHLYYGDNIDILRNYIKTETVDLIYLDPPFQSGKNYNQIFTPQAGGIKGATAQIQALKRGGCQEDSITRGRSPVLVDCGGQKKAI